MVSIIEVQYNFLFFQRILLFAHLIMHFINKIILNLIKKILFLPETLFLVLIITIYLLKFKNLKDYFFEFILYMVFLHV